MAGSVNKVILVGNLGKDPESQNFSNGGSAVKFSLATSENWKDKASGERKEKTEWHNVVIYNEALGNIAKQYCRKGSKVYLEGQLQTRKWQDQSGNDKYTTEIVLQRFRGELTLLDSPRGEGGSGAGGGGGGDAYGNRDYGDDAPRGAPAAAKKPAFGGGGGNFSDDLDDDVPF